MSATMTNPSEIEETTPAELRARMDELEQTIGKLDESLAGSRRRHESLTAERGSLVVPAGSEERRRAETPGSN
jgi:hypothetical protein